jgi:hypothetical protein
MEARCGRDMKRPWRVVSGEADALGRHGEARRLPCHQGGDMQVEIEGDQVILREVKLTLVLSKAAFIDALRRGKAHARQQAMQARLARWSQDQRSPAGPGGGSG